METEQHIIKTIEDIFNVVDEENYENFMRDFMLFVYQVGGLKRKYPKLKVDNMMWKNDGINEITGFTLNGEQINFSKSNTTEK